MAQLLRSIVVLGAFVAVLGQASPARADDAAEADETASGADLDSAMRKYYQHEKRGGIAVAGLGAMALVAGGLLIRRSSLTAKGLSYPLLGVGLLHLVACVYLYVANDARIDKFERQIADDPSAFVATEHKRMTGVQGQFTALKIVEMVLILGGGAMAVVGSRTDRKRLLGIGLALSLEAGLTLGFDIVAARSADRYVGQLSGFEVALQPTVGSDAPTVVFTHTRRF